MFINLNNSNDNSNAGEPGYIDVEMGRIAFGIRNYSTVHVSLPLISFSRLPGPDLLMAAVI